MANGGFEIPVDIKPQVQDSGNTQKFFTDLANQGSAAINKIAREAGQPIKQEVTFEVKDGKLQASIRNTSSLLKKMEQAAVAARRREQAEIAKTEREEKRFRQQQIRDIERARKEEAKRIAELEKRANEARKAELKRIQQAANGLAKLIEKERQTNAEIGKRKALRNAAMIAQKGSLNALQAELDLARLRLNNMKMGTAEYRKQAVEVKKLEAQMAKLEDSSKRSSGSIVSGFIKAQIAMAGVVAVMNQFRQVFSDTMSRGNVEQRFKNLTGSAAEYEQAIRLAKIASADFGITQTEATKGLSDLYARLKGVGYGLTEVSDIYRGFNTLAIQAGVASEDAAGAFFQLSQALGSGRLQGDELRSILERMPQVTQLIASEMGVAAGKIKEMGAAGEITSDVIYRAMKSAADGSADLTSYLTPLQIAMNESRQRAEEMRVALGDALQPAYIQAMNLLSDAGFILATAFENINKYVKENAEEIGKFISMALEIGKVVASVYVVVKAYQAWSKAVALVSSAKAGLLALTGPKGWLMIAAGVATATTAYIGMGKIIDGVGDEIASLKADSEEELAELRAEADAASDSFKGIGSGAKAGAVDAKEAFKEMKQALKEVAEEYKSKQDLVQGDLNLTKEQIGTERSLLQLQLQSAEAELDAAENAYQREKAAKRIRDLKIADARLIRQADLAEIAAAERKTELAIEELQLKRQLVKVEMSLAAARGEAVTQYQSVLREVDAGLQLARQQYQRQKAIGAEQRKQVENAFQLNKQAAQLNYETDKVFKNTKNAASAAGQYADQMERAASAADKANKSVESTVRVVKRLDANGREIEPEVIRYDLMTTGQAIKRANEEHSKRIDAQMEKIRMRQMQEREAQMQQQQADMEKAFDMYLQQEAQRSKTLVDGVYKMKEFTEKEISALKTTFKNLYSVSPNAFKGSTGGLDFSTLGRRESGGPVSGGSTYTVNERGREGFLSASGRLSEIKVPAWGSWTAPSSGEVIPAHVWSEMKAANSSVTASGSSLASSGASSVVSNVRRSGDVDNSRVTNHVTIQSASPIQAASEVMVAAAKRRRRRFR